MGRLLTEGHGALLASLPVNEDRLLLEIDVGKREVDRLLGAEPGRIDQLEDTDALLEALQGDDALALRRPGALREARPYLRAAEREEAGGDAVPRRRGREPGWGRAWPGSASAPPPPFSPAWSRTASAASGRAGPLRARTRTRRMPGHRTIRGRGLGLRATQRTPRGRSGRRDESTRRAPGSRGSVPQQLSYPRRGVSPHPYASCPCRPPFASAIS